VKYSIFLPVHSVCPRSEGIEPIPDIYIYIYIYIYGELKLLLGDLILFDLSLMKLCVLFSFSAVVCDCVKYISRIFQEQGFIFLCVFWVVFFLLNERCGIFLFCSSFTLLFHCRGLSLCSSSLLICILCSGCV